MPNRILPSLLLLVAFALPLAAADAPPAGLLDWGKQFLAYCPGETFTLEPASVPAPGGFSAWTIGLSSSSSPCSQRTTLFTAGRQAIAGRALPLSSGPRPLQDRIAERARPLLDKDVTVTIDGKKLAGGLQKVLLEFASPEGAIRIPAFIDRTQANLVIGVAGTLGVPAAGGVMDALSQGAAVRGKVGSKVVVLEISDLQCPGCATMHEGLEPFIKKNLDKLEYRRVDLASFEQHNWTLTASAAAKAIQKHAPRAYWEYVDYIFREQSRLTAASIGTAVRDFVEGHDLDWAKIEREMNSPTVRRALVSQVGNFVGHGVLATPTIYVNGRRIAHTGKPEAVVTYVEKLLGDQARARETP